MSCPTIEDKLEFNHWKTINEDFLYENFINDPEPIPKHNKNEKDFEVEPEKIHFTSTPFDRYYYKQKFPLFDDEICEILERCSIEKNKKPKPSLPTIKEEKTKPKKSSIEIKHEKFIVEFN